MRVKTSLLAPAFSWALVYALAGLLAPSAFAQPAAATLPAPDGPACQAEEASLEHDIDLARSRGQMLRRRELADALSALQQRCQAAVPAEGRAARIERLEREARALRLELERTEEQLRRLKSGSP